jgi:Transglycosylase SLT domain
LAGKHHLPRGLLAALIQVESNGRVHRISSAGAMGPGQLTPSTARLLGVLDPFNPSEAIDASGRYLAVQLSVCLRFALEQPPRPWPEQVLPYGLAKMLPITPSRWTLTESSREVCLPA